MKKFLTAIAVYPIFGVFLLFFIQCSDGADNKNKNSSKTDILSENTATHKNDNSASELSEQLTIGKNKRYDLKLKREVSLEDIQSFSKEEMLDLFPNKRTASFKNALKNRDQAFKEEAYANVRKILIAYTKQQ